MVSYSFKQQTQNSEKFGFREWKMEVIEIWAKMTQNTKHWTTGTYTAHPYIFYTPVQTSQKLCLFNVSGLFLRSRHPISGKLRNIPLKLHVVCSVGDNFRKRMLTTHLKIAIFFNLVKNRMLTYILIFLGMMLAVVKW